MAQAQDFTPTGLKIEGAWENDRNAASAELFKTIIREAFGVSDVIIAHHLTYVVADRRPDNFDYQTIEEIPSADTLIFDHDVAKKIWGRPWRLVLTSLALTPVDKRDELLAALFEKRNRERGAP